MATNEIYHRVCKCGVVFTRRSAHTAHAALCDVVEQQLDTELNRWQRARQLQMDRRRTEAKERLSAQLQHNVPLENNPEPPREPAIQEAAPMVVPQQPADTGRPRRLNRQRPKRLDDMVPSAVAALPPSLYPPLPLPPPPPPAPLAVRTRAVDKRNPLPPPESTSLDSQTNKFGLFRRYHADTFPTHDPESEVTLDDLTDRTSEDWHHGPYGSESAFQLAKWHWLEGGKKSVGSFEKLTKMVGHPDFSTDDIRHTDWKRADKLLLSGQWEDPEGPDNALYPTGRPGWQQTVIKLDVPFHTRMKQPGNAEFLAGTLHH